MENKKFKTFVIGDLDYDDLVAEVHYENHIIAMLTQEKGYENLEIVIYPPKDPNNEFWVFNFAEFNKAIQSAKNALLEFGSMQRN